MPAYNLLVILGPTASGKTSFAVQLAQQLHGEILSADSRQVYRGLDIGSGKDLDEYGNVPYHLIDIVNPGYEFNVFEFQRCFYRAFQDITARHRFPIMAGGTGLYLDAVLRQYQFCEAPINTGLREQLAGKDLTELTEHLLSLNPNLHNTTDLLDRERILRAIEIATSARDPAQTVAYAPAIHPWVFGIRWEREVLKQRIHERLQARLQQGLIEEVEVLHQQGVSWETLHFYGLEYRFVAAHLQGTLNRNDMVQKLYSAICTFSRQQEKWFRRMERQGLVIHWLQGGENLLEAALKHMASSDSAGLSDNT